MEIPTAFPEKNHGEGEMSAQEKQKNAAHGYFLKNGIKETKEAPKPGSTRIIAKKM